jgi:glycoprotein-N-acetylgalactosamine 3-beta-galactosyltransferase
MLYQYQPTTSLYIGSRFVPKNLREGYMSGGGNVLSKKALEKFININKFACPTRKNQAGDMFVGECLSKYALFIDAHDNKMQKQIFPVGVNEHLKQKPPNATFWYTNYQWINHTRGDLNCCSEYYVASHYVKPKDLYFFEYLFYHVQPFGIEKNSNDKLPRKVSFAELIQESNRKSFSKNFIDHKSVHFIDDDEKYRKRRRRKRR